MSQQPKKVYVALLRGINVGGHKKILMADLKALFETIGFTEIQTYIQSGNVVFSSEKEDDLADKITAAIESKYSFNVPILIKKASEMAQILSKCPFSAEKMEKSYFILLQENPSVENLEEATALSSPDEEFHIIDDCVYIYYSKGAGKAKLGINFFEKELKVNATARNYRTMAKLLELTSL